MIHKILRVLVFVSCAKWCRCGKASMIPTTIHSNLLNFFRWINLYDIGMSKNAYAHAESPFASARLLPLFIPYQAGEMQIVVLSSFAFCTNPTNPLLFSKYLRCLREKKNSNKMWMNTFCVFQRITHMYLVFAYCLSIHHIFACAFLVDALFLFLARTLSSAVSLVQHTLSYSICAIPFVCSSTKRLTFSGYKINMICKYLQIAFQRLQNIVLFKLI